MLYRVVIAQNIKPFLIKLHTLFPCSLITLIQIHSNNRLGLHFYKIPLKMQENYSPDMSGYGDPGFSKFDPD